jgi:hypothetical protein
MKMKKIFLLLACVTIFAGIPGVTSASIVVKPGNNLGLVGYWTMNEGSGNRVADSSGNGNAGNFVVSPTWTSGKLGSALQFDGANTYITAGSNISLTGAVTVCAWVNATSITGANERAIVSRDTSDASGREQYELYAVSPGQLWFSWGSGLDSNAGVASTDLTTGAWHYVCGNRNAALNDGHVYIDGVEPPGDGFNEATAPYAGLATTTIGNDAPAACGSTCVWNGKIDEVRIYNRQLSAAEILDAYNTGASHLGNSNAALTTNSSLTNGLVGYWTFDGADVRNSVADKSGNGNNGGFAGSATSSAVTPGKLGQALNFNGSSNYVQVPYTSSLQPTNVSVGAWFKTPNKTLHEVVVSTTESGGYELELNETGVGCSATSLLFRVRVGGIYQAACYDVSNLSNNTWYYVAGTYDGETVSLYVNGVDVNDNTSPSGNVEYSLSNPLCIGNEAYATDCTSDSPAYFSGTIDDVRVYNRALSAAEAKQLYNLGAQKLNTSSATLTSGSSLASGLVGHWTFDGKDTSWTSGTTGTTNDLSGNGNTGTLTSMNRSTATTPGKLGQALNFDGASNYVDVGSNASLGVASHTVSAWVYVSPSAFALGWGCIIQHDRNNPGNFGLFLDGGTQKFHYRWDNGDANDFATTVVPNKWYFVVGTDDIASGVVNLYLNGVLDTQFTGKSGPTAESGLAQIGTDTSGEYFKGNIDDVRVYNRALSAAEVKQLYLIRK